jgi:hypothetical protein
MYTLLEQIALEEFGELVVRCHRIGRRAHTPLKLRLDICDGTIVDIWLNPDGSRYAYHWEQRAKRGLIHRHDNAPDHPGVATHPKHFHNGAEDTIEESHIPDEPEMALRYFLAFIREKVPES